MSQSFQNRKRAVRALKYKDLIQDVESRLKESGALVIPDWIANERTRSHKLIERMVYERHPADLSVYGRQSSKVKRILASQGPTEESVLMCKAQRQRLINWYLSCYISGEATCRR
jgi:ribosomal protein S19E (S16A)